jgi:uncharacterized protein YjdB
MLKKFMMFILIVVLAFGSIINPYTAKADPINTIILTKDKEQYNIGDTVNITVEGQGENVYGVQFILEYDSNMLRLKDNGITYLESYQPFVETSIGDGKIQLAMTNQTKEIKTNNKIVKFSFTTLKNGTFDVQLKNIKAVKNVNNQYTIDMYTNSTYKTTATVNEVAVNRIEIENSKSLSIGDTVKLNAVTYPENATYKNIKWSSTNSSVVSVDEFGNVKALTPGQADIIVSSVEYPGVTAKCSVYVKNNMADLFGITVNGIAVSDFSNEKTNYDVALAVGTTSAIVATTAVDKNASVIITQLTKLPGTATIEVKSEDGNNVRVYTLNISVIKIPVTGVNINKKALNLQLGKSDTLTAKVSPKDATISDVVWSSSNPEVVYVDENGNITAKATGVAVITVTTKEGSYSDSCVVTVPVDKNKLKDKVKDAIDKGMKEIIVPLENINSGSVPIELDAIQAGQNSNMSFVAKIDNVDITMPSGVVDIAKYTNSPENSFLVVSVLPIGSSENSTSQFKIAGKTFEISMQIIDENGKVTDIHNFDNNKKVKLTIHLSEEDLKGLNIKKLSAYYFNISTNKWEEISGGTFDKETSSFTFETSHFTEFAIMESTNENTNENTNVSTNENVSENTSSTSSIPKTGSQLDLTNVISMGLMLIGIGTIFLVGRHNKKNS